MATKLQSDMTFIHKYLPHYNNYRIFQNTTHVENIGNGNTI